MYDLVTPFADRVNKACPLSEHPSPQFARASWQCLNGEYDYAVTPQLSKLPGAYEGKILVPYSIETALSGVKKPLTENYALWYRRTFVLDKSVAASERVILHFGAVDWQCSVRLNGLSVGMHTGGYCPFAFDVTSYLIDGENELTVKVTDPTDKGNQPRGKQVLKPFGFWYTATSGIWQTVWLEGVPETRIAGVKLIPDIDSSLVRLRADHPVGTRVRATVFDSGEAVASCEFDRFTALAIPSPKLWSPETPFLYDLRLELVCEGEVVDTVSSYFGMRKFSLTTDKDGYTRLCLNNAPYFQRGVLDQGYWPESGLTPPTDEAMIFDIEKMKELGFNMLRKHIKVEPARWYYHCDRLGMLVWQDMPNGAPTNLMVCGILPNVGIRTFGDKNQALYNRTDEHGKRLFMAELDEMLDALRNVVSICCWVPFNESWGQFDANVIADHVKNVDPTRFVDHASGWQDQGGGDMKSIHRYIVPLHPYKRDRRAFVVSEYGGYSIALDGHVWSSGRVGYMWFKTKDKLTKAYRSLHEKQVIPLIKKGLSAVVYTQLSDVENELNGFYTYDRRELKMDGDTVREINSKLTY